MMHARITTPVTVKPRIKEKELLFVEGFVSLEKDPGSEESAENKLTLV